MFKCDYVMNGECQLYSKKCDGKCNLYLECAGCRYKMISFHEKPCIDCFALHKKKREK